MAAGRTPTRSTRDRPDLAARVRERAPNAGRFGSSPDQRSRYRRPADDGLTNEAAMFRSVVFDIGETILDDTREFAAWADWIGVPRHTFSALLGIVVSQGRNNAETFQYFRPGFDLQTERERREAAGVGEQISQDDLYPDVRPALAALRARGLWVGLAGNQTARAASLLRQLDLPVDAIATSGEWQVVLRTAYHLGAW
jgi:hypothetical protein